MPESTEDRITLDRTILLTIGAAAGAAAFVLIEILPDRIDNERILMLVAAAAGGFFAAFLAATGPLGFPRAALAAAAAALPASALLYWASFRFVQVDDFLETGHPPVIFVAVLTILLPFLIAWQRPGDGWRSYPALFTQSWNIVVRYAAAWIFTGVFWAVVFLSDALFGLVGLDIIEDLLNIDWVPFVLTGAVLGLALAVVVELSDYVSPFLILRLIRLLLPVVLVVTAVFLAALPVQGLSDLFGGLSAAATLMAMAAGIATLITSALDRTDDDAVTAPVMRASAQVLALAMPALAALSIYAVWLRIKDYGLSPDRIAAITLGVLMLGYGVLYALAVILRRDWMARIRGANIAMALVVVAVGAVWLSPLVDPQRLSAGSQLARFTRGEVSADKLDLWFIGRELGVAGEAAISKLAALDHPEAEVLQARLARLETAKSAYIFNNPAQGFDKETAVAALQKALIVRPEGRDLPAGTFLSTPGTRLARFAEGCARQTPGGNAGCVLVLADFMAQNPGEEGILVYMSGDRGAALDVVWPANDAPPYSEPLFIRGIRSANVTPETVDSLVAGDFRLAPAAIMSLNVTGAQIILKP